MSHIVDRIRQQLAGFTPRKRISLILLVLAAFTTVGTAAWAYWTTTGAGTASATTGTLNPPTNVVASTTAGSSTVGVTWTASTTPPGVSPSGYYVTRVRNSDSTTAAACGTSPTSTTGSTSCSDTVVVDGSYHYVVTAVKATWTATSAASNDVTVINDNVGPAVTLTTPANSSNGNVTTPTLSGVAGNVTGDSATVTVKIYTGTGTGGALLQTIPVTRSGASWTTTAAPLTEGTYTAQATQTDTAGNVGTSSANTFTIDTVAPSVTVNQKAGQADPTNTVPMLWTVTFSEPVTGFDASDLTRGGTSTLGVPTVTGSGASYEISLAGAVTNGTTTFAIAANKALDLAGNNNTTSTSTDNTITLDTSAPSVTIDQGGTQSDPTNSGTVVFTATFSETVTGFTNADVTVTGTVGGTKTVVISGTGPVYTVTISGATGNGTIIASIAAASAQDPAGNNNTASTSTDDTVTLDTTTPTVTGVSSTLADGSYKAGQVVPVTVTFSESVTVTGTPQLTLSTNSPATTAVSYSSGSGTNVLTFNYTAAAGNTSADLDYASTTSLALNAGTIRDAATNNAALTLAAPAAAGSLGANKNLVIDTTPPTVTVNQKSGQADPTNTLPMLWTVTFNEPVTGFDATDLARSGTTGGTVAVSGSGASYEISLTGTPTNGTTAFTIPAGGAQDAANNGNTASTSTDNTITYDTAAPSVALTTPANNSSGNITTPTISGAAGNVAGDSPTVTVKIYSGIGTGGTVLQTIPVARSAAAWTTTAATLTQGTYTAQATQTDSLGNLGTTTANTFVIDTTAATVTGVSSTLADGPYRAGQIVPVTVTFNEPVNVTGTPQLTLSTFSPVATGVNYTSGTGTNVLTFNYTVAPGNTTADLDYAGTGSLALNTGTIRDAASNSATLTLTAPATAGSLGANKNLVIDTTLPTGFDVQVDGSGGTTAKKIDSGDKIVLTFSEQMDPSSILAGFTGASTTITNGVTVDIGGASGASKLTFNGSNLGSIDLGDSGTSHYVQSHGKVFSLNTSISMATVAGRSVLTVQLTSNSTQSDAVTSTSTVMTWAPSALSKDLAGNSTGTGPTAESGTADADF